MCEKPIVRKIYAPDSDDFHLCRTGLQREKEAADGGDRLVLTVETLRVGDRAVKRRGPETPRRDRVEGCSPQGRRLLLL